MSERVSEIIRFLKRPAAFAGIAAAFALSACVQAPAPVAGSAVGDGGAAASTGPAPVQAPPVTGPVNVALFAPLTAQGDRARALARDLQAAAELARDDLDGDIVLRVYDTGGSQEMAAAAAARALGEGANIFIGPLFGATTQAVAPVAAQRGVNVLSFSTNPQVAGGNVWLTGLLPGTEVDRVLGYAASREIGSVGVLHPQNEYGALAARAAQGSAGRYGLALGQVAAYPVSFEGIQNTTRTAAPGLRGAGAVLLPDGGDALVATASFLAYFDVNPRRVRYLGLGQWNTPATLSEQALRGGWFAAPEPALRERFAKRFTTAAGRAPHPLATLGYDAVAVVGAMASGGGATPFSAAAITAPRGFRGVNGPIRFTPDGLNQRGLAVLEVGDGAFRVIDPAPTDFGAGS